ncbi:MAG: 1,4-alpha-glucan branching protein GlgB [Acidobacteriota bacterium]
MDPEIPSSSPLAGDPGPRRALLCADADDPAALLGPHGAELGGVGGTVVRAYHPGAVGAELLQDGKAMAMESVDIGLFAVWLPGVDAALPYRLRFRFEEGDPIERDDPYRFSPSISDFDLYLANEGKHRRLWEVLGARPASVDGVAGYRFAVWAPNARRVSVVGPFCAWDGRTYPMQRRGDSGIFELFLPGIEPGELYKFEVAGRSGITQLKADPMASWAEVPPATASRTFESAYVWGDAEWLDAAETRDLRRGPMAVYEVHLPSWRSGGGESIPYRELAPRLVDHVKALGFNYIELLPVAEHPYSGSWGYQITGYYAPTSRHGDPDDFRFFVDHCHQNGIGVILDWVPAHFVKDAHGLGRFDGTALYEHADPRLGEHPDWGTYVFNYGRFEVANFLVANALYWLDEFHVDGLRVDAVASMLYLDYSRNDGEWVPNAQGGRENYDAIALLREVNRRVHELYPGRFTVAEESTAWPGITKDTDRGGLGFTFKWNMGWMHDTLGYFATDPLYRSHRHDQLTFAMVYEYSEAFVNPLSHDEVVHGKGSLLAKMPGDRWRQLAGLRVLMAYQMTRPGKALVFMGSELASPGEWNHETGLDWYLLDDPDHRAYFRFFCALGHLYRERAPLWQLDPEPAGFRWIACHDRGRSVVAYARFADAKDAPENEGEDDGAQGDGTPPPPLGDAAGDHMVVVLNLTPVPRNGYRIGAPRAGAYALAMSTDDASFGGSGYPTAERVETEAAAADGLPQSLVLDLPPLAALVLSAEPVKGKGKGAGRGNGKRRTRPRSRPKTAPGGSRKP